MLNSLEVTTKNNWVNRHSKFWQHDSQTLKEIIALGQALFLGAAWIKNAHNLGEFPGKDFSKFLKVKHLYIHFPCSWQVSGKMTRQIKIHQVICLLSFLLSDTVCIIYHFPGSSPCKFRVTPNFFSFIKENPKLIFCLTESNKIFQMMDS